MGATLSAHVEHTLDDSELFQRAVKATFSQYAKRRPPPLPAAAPGPAAFANTTPSSAERNAADAGLGSLQQPALPLQRGGRLASSGVAASEASVSAVTAADADSSWPAVEAAVGDDPASLPAVEYAQLLEAARSLLKMLGEAMDERLSRVCLRAPTKRDVEYVLFSDPELRLEEVAKGKALDFKDFERFQRGMVKRVAVDRGRRLLLFVAGGVFAVHMVKRTIRKVPLVGPPVVALVSLVLPTSMLGPAVGVAGALYIDNLPANKPH